MSRWFRVQADIFDHPMFAPAELSEREAFLWLVARAAWKDTRHRVGNEMMAVPRGSLFVTLRELQVAWRWGSDARVRNFLKMLESEAMVSRETNAGKTQISICNYDKYQAVERAENAEETQGKRTPNASETHAERTKDTSIPEYKDTSSLRSDVERASAPSRKADKRACRLPDDFAPGESGKESALKAGMTISVMMDELRRFTDYHKAKGSRMVDWQAAWRTWCGNYRPRAGPAQRTERLNYFAQEALRLENERTGRTEGWGSRDIEGAYIEVGPGDRYGNP